MSLRRKEIVKIRRWTNSLALDGCVLNEGPPNFIEHARCRTYAVDVRQAGNDDPRKIGNVANARNLGIRQLDSVAILNLHDEFDAVQSHGADYSDKRHRFQTSILAHPPTPLHYTYMTTIDQSNSGHPRAEAEKPIALPINDRAIARTIARHPRPLGGDTARNLGKGAISLTGMVLNNANDAVHHYAIGKKPDWLRARVPGGEGYHTLKSIIDKHQLHTACQEASCPNIGECWSRGTATIMILGDVCTRSCGFCNVKTGKPPVTDWDEPRRVAESLALMNLKHVVITSVDRDDLPDGGAAIWAETIRRTHETCPAMSVEVLTGDFKGHPPDVRTVCDARPEIIAHNMETVKRMHPTVRPQAKYDRSIDVLRQFKESGLVTKTGIMVGIGEDDDEVLAVMHDVRERTGADIFTIGQYLQPTRNHLPISRWVHPDQFAMYKLEGLRMGFKVVESGPLVRSSYHAEEQAERLSPDRRETVEAMEALIAGAKAQRPS